MTPSKTASSRTERDHIEEIWARAYTAQSKDDLRALYSDWARSYDADHDSIGFIGHSSAAAALARNLARRDARILDAGAGTGAAGEALHELGFTNLSAVDLSGEMLAIAKEKDLYQRLVVGDISLPVDAFAHESFDAAILVGVFSFGQAPPETLHEMLRIVRPGGLITLTMRTDFFKDDPMGIAAKLDELEEAGAWTLVELTDPEQYLPKKDPEAHFRVWTYRVTGGSQPEVEPGFEEAVETALASDAKVKELDHSWIWDTVASRLYDRYTESSGYYLTDCELEILKRDAAEIIGAAAPITGEEPLIIELGCGSALKIREVLRAAVDRRTDDKPLHYMPIDVSEGAVEATVEELTEEFGDQLAFEPRRGLFADVLHTLPKDRPKLVFFFGSSLGNVEDLEQTVAFLESVRAQLGPDDRFVVGLDLHKDEWILDAAYNRDESCRAFFVHMLRRINQSLGADFDPRVFELASTYELEPEFRGVRTHKMNLRISPTRDQRSYVQELEQEVVIRKDHAVQVGISRKFEPQHIDQVAAWSGFDVARRWYDERQWFSLTELVPTKGTE